MGVVGWWLFKRVEGGVEEFFMVGWGYYFGWGPVAQYGLEHQAHNLGVVGSNPSGPILFSACRWRGIRVPGDVFSV